jgi:hypothetical protein
MYCTVQYGPGLDSLLELFAITEVDQLCTCKIFFQEIKTPEREEMAGRGTFLLWLWNLLEVEREGELKVST